MAEPHTDIENVVHGFILETWMPVAAIAVMAKIPTKTALAILQRRAHDWGLECRRVRIDGKNPVYCFRCTRVAQELVFGVWMPVKAEEVEE